MRLGSDSAYIECDPSRCSQSRFLESWFLKTHLCFPRVEEDLVSVEFEDPLDATIVAELPFEDVIDAVELAGIEVVRVDEKPVSEEW